MQRGLPERRRIQDVQKVIAVSSAKGGVGKSTIAANLALSFARNGYKAGILDTDIFGPSIPTLLNLSGEPRLSSQNKLIPLSNYGIKSMSMGFLVGEEAPVVWRGLMVMKAIQQLLHDVDWGGLDVLVLDLPPGTGDTQLTITQQVELDGAVIVSTPQDIALKDAIKGVNMFRKVNVSILGMIQNMSVFICPHCNKPTHIFGAEGVSRECQKHGVDFLGDIPLDASICDDADRGKPTVVAEPESSRAESFLSIARKLQKQIQAKLELGVAVTLFNWPALSLAVQNKWGGPDSEGKREWLAGTISEMFTERPSTDLEDVETTLLQVMLDEFEVNVDDDSAYVVAEQIVQLRESTSQGDFSKVDQLYEAWKEKGGSSAIAFQQADDQDDSTEGEDSEESTEEDEDVEMEDALVKTRPARPKPEPEVDGDGFMKVVGRSKRGK
ncbi:MAG: hypothetical protein M1823_002608 [Watsoniomyces obsoletus]|nr:MAG: hypothetical protein M1823_002608 [Watsoniomyces obsoletus]